MAMIIANGKVFTTDQLSETEIVYQVDYMTRSKHDFSGELRESIDSDMNMMELDLYVALKE